MQPGAGNRSRALPLMTISRRNVLKRAANIAGAIGLAPLCAIGETASPVVDTSFGPVRGYADKGIRVFKGVRYAADTAPRRFLPPLPPKPWDEVVDCFEYGNSAPQAGGTEAVSRPALE